jgi:2-polyprenyl-6-methoxyphenol hydroxylase-like FAD-dependent oxidoreductase
VSLVDLSTDVVVVGGEIAGAAVAKAAAETGLRVTVLERQTSYRDKVRGEWLAPWGVVEARQLGVEDVLLAAGGTWTTHLIPYDENVSPADAAASPVPIGDFVPDVPGALAVGHPAACQAIGDAAAAAGAVMARGVGEVTVTPGAQPIVRYELDDVEYEVPCRLVVGADGRAASVRRQLGCGLHQSEVSTMGGGLLVDGLDPLPPGACAIGTEGDLHYYVSPRADGQVRLYLNFSVSQRGRFSGPDRVQEVLESFRLSCLPSGEEIAAAAPAGPATFYQWNDSWMDTPCAPGVVLIGDAAGWNDPIIGQGLAIALRDARTVADVLRLSDDWTPPEFEGYKTERAERMRRLRINAAIQTEIFCTFSEEGRQRRRAFTEAAPNDPLAAAATLLCMFAGPEVAPAEAFEPQNIERILSFA